MFSVDTEEEADDLIRLVGSLQYHDHPDTGKPWFKLSAGRFVTGPQFLELSDLDDVTDLLAERYQLLK